MSDRAERMATVTLPREIEVLGAWCVELLERIEKLEAAQERLKASLEKHQREAKLWRSP